MTTIQDIENVNNLLKQGHSLNFLDKNNTLGCSRRAFCNHAKKLGYIFTKESNQFIKDDSINIKQDKPLSNKTINKKKPPVNVSNNDSYHDLESRIKALEDIVLRDDTLVIPNKLELDSRINDDITTRGMKVSKTALLLFDTVCKELPAYNKQDLLSQALFEFVDKYKKKDIT